MLNCNLSKNFNNTKCKKQVGEGHFIIILPKADNSKNKIKPSSFYKYIDKINERFSGSTTKPITLGCWKDPKRDRLQCETGFSIEVWRDFDSSIRDKRLNSFERKKKMHEDFIFMNKLARESAKEFGQSSVPVIFENVVDVKLNKGIWKKRIDRKKLTGKKIKGDLWKKYI